MRKYKITVSGKSYEVEVEEIGGQSPSTALKTIQTPSAPVEQPKLAQQTTPPPQKKAGAGTSKITCPMPGTILTINAKVGSQVQKGDVVMILEAMKMENEIIAPEDGVITSIDTSEGAAVNTGDILATFE